MSKRVEEMLLRLAEMLATMVLGFCLFQALWSLHLRSFWLVGVWLVVGALALYVAACVSEVLERRKIERREAWLRQWRSNQNSGIDSPR